MARPGHGHRSIPAWAGEPNNGDLLKRFEKVYPRVGGGTTRASPMDPAKMGLSPRGRGNPTLSGPFVPPVRSIPAWAGEPATAKG